jgi:hypothetical protein
LHVGNQSETHREIPVEIAEGLVRSLADVEPTLSAYTSSPTGKRESREREKRERRREIYIRIQRHPRPEAPTKSACLLSTDQHMLESGRLMERRSTNPVIFHLIRVVLLKLLPFYTLEQTKLLLPK